MRLEVRLGNRRKIRHVLDSLPGYGETPLTLRNLYSQPLAKAVLLKFWEPFYAGLPAITATAARQPSELYHQIAMANPDTKDSQLLKLLGAHYLLDDIGWTGAKSLWKSNNRTLQRLGKQLEKAHLMPSVAVKSFKQIQTALEVFEPVTIEAFKFEGTKTYGH